MDRRLAAILLTLTAAYLNQFRRPLSAVVFLGIIWMIAYSINKYEPRFIEILPDYLRHRKIHYCAFKYSGRGKEKHRPCRDCPSTA